MDDLLFANEVCVNIINETDTPVYLNTEMVPGGVLTRSGVTYIDGDRFWVISSTDSPIIVHFNTNSYFHKKTRWLDGDHYMTMNKVGQAFGLTNIRVTDKKRISEVTVVIQRG